MDLGVKAFAGYRFHKNAAVEGGYHYFGKAQGDSTSAFESQGVSLALLGILPVTSEGSVFLKVGAMWGWIDEDATDTESSASGFSPIIGLGFNIDLSEQLALRTEVEYVPGIGAGDGGSEADVDIVSGTASLIWKFGALGAPGAAGAMAGAKPAPGCPCPFSAPGGPAPLGAYAGLGLSIVTQDGFNDSVEAVTTGLGIGGKAFVGYKFHKYAAVEAAYHYFDDAGDTEGLSYQSQGISVALLGIIPLGSDGRTSLFAKVGGIYGWMDQQGTTTDVDTSGLSPIAGVGVQFDVNEALSIRGEMEYVERVGDGENADESEGDIDVLAFTVSALWHFGAAPSGDMTVSSMPPGAYAGVGVSIVGHDGCQGSDEEDACSSERITGEELGAKVFGGYRFHKYAAAEASYHYFGEARDRSSSQSYESQGVSLALLGILPLTSDGQGSAFVKLGLMYGWFDEDKTATSHDDSGLSPIIGAGVQFDISDSIAIRGEVEYVHDVGTGFSDDGSEGDVSVVAGTASVLWKLGGGDEIGGRGMATGEPARLGIYVGGGVSLVSLDGLEGPSEAITGIELGLKGFAGWRFNKYAAVEAAYHYFGDARNSDHEDYESQGVSLALLGILPITSDGTGSVFVKVGGIYGWIDHEDTATGADSSGLSPIAGIGAEFDLSDQLTVRGEMEYVNDIGQGEQGFDSDKSGSLDVLSFTASALWRF